MKSTTTTTLLPLLVLVIVLGLATCQQSRRHSTSGDNNNNNFPKDDFAKFFRDVRKSLGLDSQSLNHWNRYFTKIFYEGQVYTWRQFERDYAKVKENPSPSSVLGLIRKSWWPAVVHGCSRIVTFFTDMQQFLLKFLERKCDKHIGRNNQFHPWNILKTQDATNISFLVFVYMLALSFILIKLLSVWNFSVYLATTGLLYYNGGPKLLFNCLLTVTALAWFLLDLILRNPLQAALLIVVTYALSMVRNYIASSASRRNNRQRTASNDNVNDARQKQHQRRRSSGRDSISSSAPPGPDRDEFNLLTERIEGMEMRTNLLCSKLDKLSKTIERVVPDDDDDDE